MKPERQNQNAPTQREKRILKRPENKDNLDSRKREEQIRQGDKMTNNSKEKKSENKSD
ncbi:hypothetical protein [Moheibacter sp.]|jgi:hypothetical protein|uniref:hypothetical protein n=1 Tax=Moheibacter sp. TaxID=1965316 RepID=UPI0016BC3D08|nr:hypothetical protein [Flavobacteriaceae bacterium]